MRALGAPASCLLLASAGARSCWDGGYGPAYCCRGRGGRRECWDSLHTFEACCDEYLNGTNPFADLLMRRAERRSLLAELGSWGSSIAAEGASPAVRAHRRCVGVVVASGAGVSDDACRDLEALAAEEAAAPGVTGSQYVGLQYRLVLRQYPYSYFVAPAYDNFYKAKVFPSEYWGSDDYALFEAGFRSLLACGDVAVDAGANIGGYTQMMASSVCATGRVHSFEPFRLTFQTMNANVALAGLVNVETYHKALSNKHSRTRAIGSDVRDPRQSTIWNSLVIPHETVTQHENGWLWSEHQADEEEVETVTLDSLALPRLDFMKIDVEAMEGHVLLGGFETLQRHWPSILVEIKGFQRKAIHTLLVKDLGYECYSALSTNPSDFFCVHPSRRGDPRVVETRRLWTTPAAFDYCLACQRRRPAPLEVDVDLATRVSASGSGGPVDEAGASGVVFDVEAKRVAVQVLGVTVGFHRAPANYEVWVARTSGAQGRIVFDEERWELLASGEFRGEALRPHFMPFSKPVQVEPRTRRAIYVFAGRPLEGRLVAGTTAGVSAEDDSVVVHSGDCSKPDRWQRFGVRDYELAGSIRYTQV